VTAEEVFRRIIGKLEQANVPYMVTGSFASAFHGVPRATQDIDLDVAPSEDQLRALLRLLPPEEYCVDEVAALEAARAEAQFNVIDLEAGWKIDLIVRKGRPFSRAEFERRGSAKVWGLALALASLEDVILAKLEWARLGQSERQLEDVVALLRVRGPDLDRAYLDRWIPELGVASEWIRVVQRAGLGE
jgi:hypothetical protein